MSRYKNKEDLMRAAINNARYQKTKQGRLSMLYRGVVKQCRRKGVAIPYTLDTFREYFQHNNEFLLAFRKWKSFQYVSDMAPTLERINIQGGFEFENLRVKQLAENRCVVKGTSIYGENHYERLRLGIVNRYRAPVIVFKDGKQIAQYDSTKEAAQGLGIRHPSNITNVLRGKNKSAFGFTFQRKGS
ncbi:hypothetical protein GCM10027347_52520 [Larkinella harenae]